jgi:hypothetical protein
MILIFDFVVSYILVSVLFDRLRVWTNIDAVAYSGPFWAAVSVLFVLIYAAIKLWVRHLERQADEKGR